MDKILIKLFVPTIDKEYDIWIPQRRKIYSAINLIVKAIGELTNGEYNPSKLPKLYDKKTGELYDVNLIIYESNIENGSEIILI